MLYWPLNRTSQLCLVFGEEIEKFPIEHVHQSLKGNLDSGLYDFWKLEMMIAIQTAIFSKEILT